MKRSIGVLILALVAIQCVTAKDNHEDYKPSVYGMQSILITCDTEQKLAVVRKHDSEDGYDFVNIPRKINESFVVYVTADKAKNFKNELDTNDIEFKVLNEDISKLIVKERSSQFRHNLLRSSFGNNMDFKHYPRYEEIKEYIENLGETHKEIVKSFSLGKSFEGRDIVAVKFSTGGENKPAILIDAGIHAREWIAPTTALYIIKELAEKIENRKYFEDIDIYIIPLLNPDGYEYTHLSVETRMWRKTRSKNPNSKCYGADANRNFDYYWAASGTNPNPCSQLYPGYRAFSEPETRALRDFMLARRDRIKVYLSFHSFGGYFLHPWGYAKVRPVNEANLMCAARTAVGRLKELRDTKYKVGSSAILLYEAAGGSDDYAMGVANIELAYTVELPGSWPTGFFPPTSEIIPVGKETFEAIKVFTQYINGEICDRPTF